MKIVIFDIFFNNKPLQAHKIQIIILLKLACLENKKRKGKYLAR